MPAFLRRALCAGVCAVALSAPASAETPDFSGKTMWRTVFIKAVQSPELLAAAKKGNIPVGAKDHRHLEALVKRLHTASPEVIAAAREARGVI